ncbi:MAG: M3 family peptidase, partial [Paraglaciecola sp.]
MNKPLTKLACAAVLIALSACSEKTTVKVAPPKDDNPLLAEFSGPYGGVPAFDKMDLSYLKPALEQGMALNLTEIDAIVNNPAPATFANTIVPLEKAGSELSRVFRYWGIWSSNLNSPEFRKIQKEMVPV